MSTEQKAKPARKSQAAQQLTVLPKVIKDDTYLVVAGAAYQPDDEFVNLYYTANNTGGVALKPPFDPRTLKHLVVHNNVLSQCVEAMSVNIDGTGHEFVPAEVGEDIDEAEKALVEGFFSEPFPGTTFISLRRDLRNDLESLGYGYIEFLRTLDGTPAGMRYQDATVTRMVKLDAPVQVTKMVVRNGKETPITFWDRERRFVQLVNGTHHLYFREFGSSRHLNRDTGEWETPEKPVPVEKRATELIFVGVTRDHNTPYYLPRWINQLPSVLGSRKAEEQNLEFFDAGGMPPAIIFIQGGAMVGSASEQLRTYLSAQNKNKGRAIVVELQSSSGSLESSGSVSAKVERFGAQQANDAMFSKYDATAEEHVRVGFRLPPLFIGKAADYNFATAQTTYMVAEAQVFQPERSEFDELINKTVLRELGVKSLRFQSKPITLKSVDSQISAMTMVVDKVEGENLISEVNKVTGLTLEYKEPEPVPPGLSGGAPGAPAAPAVEDGEGTDEVPQDELADLARKYAVVTGRAVLKGDVDMTPDEQVEVVRKVDALPAKALPKFAQMVSSFAPVVPHCNH